MAPTVPTSGLQLRFSCYLKENNFILYLPNTFHIYTANAANKVLPCCMHTKNVYVYIYIYKNIYVIYIAYYTFINAD